MQTIFTQKTKILMMKMIGALKLNAYKIGMDPNIIDAAETLVSHELTSLIVENIMLIYPTSFI